MDLSKGLLTAATVVMVLASGVAGAQRIDHLEFSNEPGDKLVFNFTSDNKTQRMEETFSGFTDTR